MTLRDILSVSLPELPWTGLDSTMKLGAVAWMEAVDGGCRWSCSASICEVLVLCVVWSLPTKSLFMFNGQVVKAH